MAKLPVEFTTYTRQLMGDERFERYLQSFEEEAPVSIRLNPRKPAGIPVDAEEVAWCRNAYYLKSRPNFTFDPLFHAGCYYVQEAASMFLDEVLRQHLSGLSFANCLDLCAAPGGKSTLLRSALPEDCVLYSNEPVRNRASILSENIQKWGYPNCYVTNAYPKDYRKAKMKFDVILCDVPCSGEGMFRKDEATIREWSPQNVEKCWRLQREIVADAWECLVPGGLYIYSTCTFNTQEDEENVRWMTEDLGAEILNVETESDWHITGSLLKDFHAPVYRFIPGTSCGEGLFMAVMRKRGRQEVRQVKRPVLKGVKTILDGVKAPLQKGLDVIPDVSEALSTTFQQGKYPLAELTYEQAVAYLRKEAVVLDGSVSKGIVAVAYRGLPLGFAKNIGTRANNLYPAEWKIKSTHLPDKVEIIVKKNE